MIVLYFILLFLIVVFGVFYVVQFYNILFRGFAPYINTNGKTMHKIISEIDLRGNETIYELGCGNAGFLQLLGKKYPNTILIGVEYSFLPWLIAQIQIKLYGIKNLQIIKKNIFDVDLAPANIIYCYLFSDMMKKLASKFDTECQTNTQIISNKFQMPNRTPQKVIESKGEKVYFYKT